MTEPRDPLAAALRRLRDEVRDRVPAPPPAAVRELARRRSRVRRTGAAGLVAAAVLAVVIGGAGLLQLVAAPAPVPPAHTPSPTGSPEVTAHPTPSASPTPPAVPPVTPSPRAAPRQVEPPDDPILDVDWFTATIQVPAHESCPSGPVRLSRYTDGSFTSARAFVDGTVFEIPPPELVPTHYGDLTGDGRLEVIVEIQCFLSDDGTGHGAGHGGHLLVVSRDQAGALTGLSWVGPSFAAIVDTWVSQGRLLMYGDPWVAGPEDIWNPVPGLALAYRWNGGGFDDWVPAPEYPTLMPHTDPSQPGAPVRPRAVATGLGCPDVELRFREGRTGIVASGGGATWVAPPRSYHLLDLDRTGTRLLVLPVRCTDRDGWTRGGLAIFEPAGDGWQGIWVLRPPEGHHHPGGVRFIDGEVVVDWTRDTPEGGEPGPRVAYRWTGTVLEAVDRS